MWHPAVRQSTMETWTLNIKVITPLCSTMNSFKRSKQHFCVSHAVKTPASLKWPFEELQLLALPQWVIFFCPGVAANSQHSLFTDVISLEIWLLCFFVLFALRIDSKWAGVSWKMMTANIYTQVWASFKWKCHTCYICCPDDSALIAKLQKHL